MAQLISITSEALQSTVRRLLPSQQGFGEDLQATNVVTPIIDLTPTAEGTQLPRDLQVALAFSSISTFSVRNTTTSLGLSGGFWRFKADFQMSSSTTTDIFVGLYVNDGTTDKLVTSKGNVASTAVATQEYNEDFILFLRPGDDVKIISNNFNALCTGVYQQIANVNGELQPPGGFNPQ